MNETALDRAIKEELERLLVELKGGLQPSNEILHRAVRDAVREIL